MEILLKIALIIIGVSAGFILGSFAFQARKTTEQNAFINYEFCPGAYSVEKGTDSYGGATFHMKCLTKDPKKPASETNLSGGGGGYGTPVNAVRYKFPADGKDHGVGGQRPWFLPSNYQPGGVGADGSGPVNKKCDACGHGGSPFTVQIIGGGSGGRDCEPTKKKEGKMLNADELQEAVKKLVMENEGRAVIIIQKPKNELAVSWIYMGEGQALDTVNLARELIIKKVREK